MLNQQRGYKEKLPKPEYLPIKSLVGVDVAERIMRSCKSGKTLVYFDPDVDGLIAGLFFCQVLQAQGIAFETYVNTNREHGFQLDGSKYRGWTILNGDFLVTEEQAISLLKEGISLLSIDHHDCQSGMIHYVRTKSGVLRPGSHWHNGRGSAKYRVPLRDIDAEVIVINNQYPFEDISNRYQSGAGVTYQVLSGGFKGLATVSNRALVGVSLITDIRDIESPGARAWLWDSYHSEYTGYIKYLISGLTENKRKYEFGIPKLERHFISYTLAPMLNAMFRFNREEEVVSFILGGGLPGEDFQALQRKFVSGLLSKVHKTDYANYTVAHIDANDFSYSDYPYLSNFVGLIASKLLGQSGGVLGYMTNYSGEVERASFRGTQVGAGYREALTPYIDGRGHSIAFGIKGLKPSNELFESLNQPIAQAEGTATNTDKYIKVRNLDVFNRSNLTVIAERNGYLLEQNQVYLKYTGRSVVVEGENTKYPKYRVDGVLVKCFDSSLSIEDGLIHPYISMGKPVYVLTKAFNENTAEELDKLALMEPVYQVQQ